jgi:hypothetical protein
VYKLFRLNRLSLELKPEPEPRFKTSGPMDNIIYDSIPLVLSLKSFEL